MNPLYSFIKYNLRWYNALYFKNVEYKGLERIPQDAGVLYVVNHQNAFMDAMLVGTPLQKNLFFLVRSDVFKGVLKYLLKIFNLIPIYRSQDGHKDGLRKNLRIFKKCISALNRRKNILIFPEGGSRPIHQITPIKKGFARIAVSYAETHKNPMFIVPVTINYEHHFQPGYRTWLEYHEPIRINKETSVTDLTQKLTTIFEQNLVHLEPDWKIIKEAFLKSDIPQIRGAVSESEISYFEDYEVEKGRVRFLNFLFAPYLWLIKMILAVVDDEDFFGSIVYVLGLSIFLGQLLFWISLSVQHYAFILPGLLFSILFLVWIKRWRYIEFR